MNLEKEFRLFLILKLLFNEGKLQQDSLTLKTLCLFLGYTDVRSVKRLLKNLIRIGWLRVNLKTNYYIIVSWDSLRRLNSIRSRASYRCYLSDLDNIYGFIGGALITYAHKNFWGKVRKKSVQIEGCTYHRLPPFSNYLDKYAPLSIVGLSDTKMFDLGLSKMSRLKNQAKALGVVKVKSQYKELPFNSLSIARKYSSRVQEKDGKFYLRSIDLILPSRPIVKRQRLIR